MKIEEAYAYLRYKDIKLGWYENVTEYEIERVVKTSFGWMVEIKYVDQTYDNIDGEIKPNGIVKDFLKSIHVDTSDYNNWKAVDRNNKLNDLGVDEGN